MQATFAHTFPPSSFQQVLEPRTRLTLTTRTRAYPPEVQAFVPRTKHCFVPTRRVIDAFAVTLHPDNAGAALNLLLTGEPGTGKTESIAYVASIVGAPLFVIEFSAETRVDDLLGRHELQQGSMAWRDGLFTRAWRAGGFCALDEIALCSPGVASALYGALAGQALRLRTGEVIPRHPDFVCVATSNTWGGRDTAANRRRFNGSEAESAAMRSRFQLTVEMTPPDVAHTTAVLHARLRHCSPDRIAMAKTMAQLFVALREESEGPEAALRHAPTLREFIAALQVWETPRGSVDGLAQRAMEEVLALTVLPSYPADEREAAREVCRAFLISAESST